jgi:hypothetical protein
MHTSRTIRPPDDDPLDTDGDNPLDAPPPVNMPSPPGLDVGVEAPSAFGEHEATHPDTYALMNSSGSSSLASDTSLLTTSMECRLVGMDTRDSKNAGRLFDGAG